MDMDGPGGGTTYGGRLPTQSMACLPNQLDIILLISELFTLTNYYRDLKVNLKMLILASFFIL